ncbi:MAG TPA: GNAT family N-acetyltransferase [Prolixibacteraceae bacterium]|nr:GNAT family N-acetyltransferase [Prolixibacteraceae bacterium]
MKEDIVVVTGDIFCPEHQKAMLYLLDLYMQDPMGDFGQLTSELAGQLIDRLKMQPHYRLFLAQYKNKFAGFANCFEVFSTFQAKPILNIHDFAVAPDFRRLGVGDALMKGIMDYARNHGFCKITLEVRQDNEAAQYLYRRNGFSECEHPMLFWENRINDPHESK